MIKKIYKDDTFADVTINCKDNKILKAHKCVLKAGSKKLGEKCLNTNLINMKDYSVEIIKNILDFIYLKKINFITNYVQDYMDIFKLIKLADLFGIDGLKAFCENYLIQNLSINHVCKILIASDLSDNKNLKSISLNYFKEHKESIINTKNFNQLIQNYPDLVKELILL